jgi:hypothetical protein
MLQEALSYLFKSTKQTRLKKLKISDKKIDVTEGEGGTEKSQKASIIISYL